MERRNNPCLRGSVSYLTAERSQLSHHSSAWVILSIFRAEGLFHGPRRSRMEGFICGMRRERPVDCSHRPPLRAWAAFHRKVVSVYDLFSARLSSERNRSEHPGEAASTKTFGRLTFRVLFSEFEESKICSDGVILSAADTNDANGANVHYQMYSYRLVLTNTLTWPQVILYFWVFCFNFLQFVKRVSLAAVEGCNWLRCLYGTAVIIAPNVLSPHLKGIIQCFLQNVSSTRAITWMVELGW